MPIRNNSKFTRRDFLKLMATLPLGMQLSSHLSMGGYSIEQISSKPNLIIILFDTLSASHLSLYGYPRETSPNINRFAKTANVYHAHRSAGNFTTPSTASLFTSSYPWTHRAFSLSGLIHPSIQQNNIFGMLDGTYNQTVFTQNIYADMLLYQFHDHFDKHQNLDSFSIAGSTFYNKVFNNDAIFGLKSYDQFLFIREEAHGSLFLSIINDINQRIRYELKAKELEKLHPGELPRLSNTDIYFLLENVMDGTIQLLQEIESPAFVYLHFMPPHEPYVPTRPFIGMFDDGWRPIEKKKHRLAPGVPQDRLNDRRQSYDEYIANIDFEFGRLIDHMTASGLLDNSYVILTSDHGELFERGVHGHSTPLVFEPVINVPLVISTPGQTQRNDIFTNTSNVDILPTLLYLAGIPKPTWCEGEVLPGISEEANTERNLFVVEAKKNPANSPLTKATTIIIRGNFKLIHYNGYKNYNDRYEFYDLKEDPLELNNQYDSHPISKELMKELAEQEQKSNQPFTKD